jgi:hypothetical protein
MNSKDAKGTKEAKAALPLSQVWAGRSARLVLLGKKSLNGASFTERYDMEIAAIDGNASVADVLRDALAAVAAQTDIPADLLEGVEFRVLPAPRSPLRAHP